MVGLMIPPPGNRTSRLPWLGLLACLVAVNVPYWDRTVWPSADTITCFQTFYTFYNNWFLHGELTRWLPYGNCGIQADYWQLFNLTPAAYFAGWLGGIFRVRNVLWLFKFSLLLEQMMMLYGCFLLCGKLFRNAATRIFVCLALLMSTVWLLQVYWNFRIYYLLPLVLYLLLDWMDTGRFRALALAGLVSVFSLVGNIVYYGALYFVLLMLFGAVLLARVRFMGRALRNLRPTDMAWLFLFLAAAGLYLYFAAHMLDHVYSITPGRETGSRTVTLARFLTEGTGIGFGKFSELVLPLQGRDYTLYAGGLPVIFAVYALVRVRDVRLAACLVPALFLALLSVGNGLPIAAWVYHLFPPMRWFHYIGQVMGLLRFFLILCSGFGLDWFLADRAVEGAGLRGQGGRIFLVFLAGLVAALGVILFFHFRQLLPPFWIRLYPITWGLLLSGSLLLGLVPRTRARWAGGIAVTAMVLDLGAFQMFFIQGWPCRWPDLDARAARVRPYDYQAVRKETPDANTGAYLAERAVEAHPVQRCEIEAHQFMQFDSGWSMEYLNLFWTEGLQDFLKTRGQLVLEWQQYVIRGYVHWDRIRNAAMGWGAPKLRLCRDVAYVPDGETVKWTVMAADLERTAVLETTPPAAGQANVSDAGGGMLNVDFFTFNQLAISARDIPSGGAWLYYADSYHPGWTAYVDNRPVPIVRANLAFKAVHLPAGPHEVRLEYTDGARNWASHALAVAAFLFAAGLLGCALAAPGRRGAT